MKLLLTDLFNYLLGFKIKVESFLTVGYLNGIGIGLYGNLEDYRGEACLKDREAVLLDNEMFSLTCRTFYLSLLYFLLL